MGVIILVMLVCIIAQVFIAIHFYKYSKNKQQDKSVNTLTDKYYAGSNTLLDTIIKLHSSIYKRQVNEKNKEMFFATLIHDLKTPLSAQKHSLELLLSGKFGNMSEPQLSILKEMLFSENYMSEIVSNILTTYKCDNNKLKLDKISYNLTTQVNEICDSLAKLSADKQQTLSLIIPNEKIVVNCDKFQLQRVITNLISNAIKYGIKNSQIKISMDIRNDYLNFSVTNKSLYIPKHKISKVFDKFSGYNITGSNNANTGLGLYLSKKLIELHGGKMYAESFMDGTCIFGFYLKIKYNTMKENLMSNMH